MSLLSWFDNRTLFACQCMLATMFSIVFLWMNHAYPQIKGLKYIAIGFVAAIPCTLFMISRGFLAPFLSVTLVNFLALVAFLLLYEGVARFVGEKGHQRILIPLACVSIVVVYYFGQVRPNIVPRIIAMGLVTAIIRAATAWLLLYPSATAGQQRPIGSRSSIGERRSAWRSRHGARRFLGVFLVVMALVGFERTVGTILFGAPQDFMQRSVLQTSTMVLNVIYIGTFGLCFLIMASQELLAYSQEESERDLLSGTLNRRGIEAQLLLELKRSNRNGQRLSIALVDIDSFKAINDSLGHAGGDAAIRAVAGALSDRLRDVDFVGRYGGDEFLVVLPHTILDNAKIVAQRLAVSAQGLGLPGLDQRITLSIGLTEASPDDDVAQLIGRADEALYLAKSAGRNCHRAIAPSATYPETAPSYQTRISAES